MKTLLWLDDIRNPLDNNWLKYSPIEQPYKTIWVKNYEQFIDWIKINKLPNAICFDHDLGLDEHFERISGGMSKRQSRKLKVEKTGYDCAKWLVDYCIDNNVPLPEWNIQSANPAGKENIQKLLENFKKFRGLK